MIVLPFDIDESRTSGVLVIIEHDNFERMKEHDPLTVAPVSMGGILKEPVYPGNFHLLIAYEEDSGPCYELIRTGNIVGLIEHVRRGYKRRPVDGEYIRNGQHGGTA
jgi:hypothetical protein